MKTRAFVLGLIGLTVATATSAAERPTSKAEITQAAVGRTVSGAMYYGKDGSYTYQGGSPGRYTISDGKICVDFNSGNRRCDTIMRDGANLFLVNASGQRFPFK